MDVSRGVFISQLIIDSIGTVSRSAFIAATLGLALPMGEVIPMILFIFIVVMTAIQVHLDTMFYSVREKRKEYRPGKPVDFTEAYEEILSRYRASSKERGFLITVDGRALSKDLFNLAKTNESINQCISSNTSYLFS